MTNNEKFIKCYKGYDIVKKYNEPINYTVMHFSENIFMSTSWLESLPCIIKTGNGDMNLVSKKIKEIGGYYKPFEIDNGFTTLEQAHEFIDWLKTLELASKLMEA